MIRPEVIKKLFPHVRRDVLIAPLTTFGLGGLAAYYLKVTTPEELVASYLKALTYNSRGKVGTRTKALGLRPLLMAGGSNVIFPDDGFSGLLIHYLNPKSDLRISPLSTRGFPSVITCEAGLPLAKLISFAIKNNLAGLEALSGIPGTVGGAIVGNAGAYGQSISDHIVRVQIFDPSISPNPLLGGGPGGVGRVGVRWISKKQAGFIYRHSLIKDKKWLVLRAVFNLEKGDKIALLKKSREIIKIRNARYTPGLKSPGSFFKNVLVSKISKKSLALIDQTKIRDNKIPAGYLLEEVEAKGLRVGEAVVANFHGNLIINEGHATAREVLKLAKILKDKVQKKFGIKLEEEVRYMV